MRATCMTAAGLAEWNVDDVDMAAKPIIVAATAASTAVLPQNLKLLCSMARPDSCLLMTAPCGPGSMALEPQSNGPEPREPKSPGAGMWDGPQPGATGLQSRRPTSSLAWSNRVVSL